MGGKQSRLSGNQPLAVLTQQPGKFPKWFKALILCLSMKVTVINLLQDNGETPVAVNQVKRKVGGIDARPLLVQIEDFPAR